jgi:hypothetical protein
MHRYFIVMNSSQDAQLLADRLRLRGFNAETVERPSCGSSLVGLGSVLLDSWKAGAQMSLDALSGTTCVIAADEVGVRMMTPVRPNPLSMLLDAN